MGGGGNGKVKGTWRESTSNGFMKRIARSKEKQVFGRRRAKRTLACRNASRKGRHSGERHCWILNLSMKDQPFSGPDIALRLHGSTSSVSGFASSKLGKDGGEGRGCEGGRGNILSRSRDRAGFHAHDGPKAACDADVEPVLPVTKELPHC